MGYARRLFPTPPPRLPMSHSDPTPADRPDAGASGDNRHDSAGERQITLVRIDPQGRVIRRSDGRYPASGGRLESTDRTSDDGVHLPTTEPAPGRRPDAVSQSLILLGTMTVMLLAARFIAPRIIEEARYAWHRGQLRAEYDTGSAGLRNVSLDALSQAYQMVTSVVGPSVVHIDVRRPRKETLLGSVRSGPSDQGSGVIVDAEGYVLTNQHVIEGGDDIFATLSDGRRRRATVVGVDPKTDLAVLKIDADELIPITWGDSDACRVGSPVWAVGSPFGLDRTVTFGILSGKHRLVKGPNTRYQDLMQSDVAVNPGNSGGPLVDAGGTLVGINTMIVGERYQGISFAIPSTVAKQIYERLRDGGRVQRAWLGVQLAEVPDAILVGDNARLRGALVGGLTEEYRSPAREAGIEQGDLILYFDDRPVRDVAHLMQLIGGSLAGTDVRLGIYRRGEHQTFDVHLGVRKAD